MLKQVLKQGNTNSLWGISPVKQRAGDSHTPFFKGFLPFFISCFVFCLVISFVLCFICGSAAPVFASGGGSSRYLIDQWDTGDGLPGNGVLAITQTPDGYLWVATSKGLSRFDGIAFESVSFLTGPGPAPIEKQKGAQAPKQKYTFPEVLFTDRSGILWIGSSAGLTRYDYRSRQFKTYTGKDGMTVDRIRLLNEDLKGNLWISFDVSYLNRFSHGKFTPFNASHGLEGRKINGIVEDANGRLLFGTREHGVFRFSSGKFYPYPVPGLTRKCFIITMYEDGDGDLWIGTSNGLFQLPRTDGSVRVITKQDGLSADYITNVVEDRDGHIWTGTVNGLNRMTRDASGAFQYRSFLEDRVITCFFIDREQSLWVGTYDSGLRRLKKKKIFTADIGAGQPGEMVYSLNAAPNGDTWVGTLSGRLYRCRGNTVKETVRIPEVSGTGLSAAAWGKNGVMWLGTNGKGVFRKENGRITNYSTQNGLADDFVNSIFVDGEGRPWFSTAGGVSMFDGGKIKSFKIPGSGPAKVVKVYNIYETPGHGFLMATGNGIAVMEKGRFIDDELAKAFAGIPVMCIHRDAAKSTGDPPVLWIATRGAGLKRWKNNSASSFTTAEGMTTNFIYQVFEDRRQNLWMTSDSGVLRVSKDELNQLADKKIRRITCTAFGLDDGMKSTEFNNFQSFHSVVKNSSGAFWLSTRKGIAVVNTDQIKINKTPPPVVVQKVLIDGKVTDFEPLNRRAGPFKDVDRIEVNFTAPTFLSPKKIAFRYRLDPVDKEWGYLAPGERRAAVYTGLGPGTYTFRVSAANNDGVWNNEGTSVTFIITVGFFSTIYFKVVVVVCILVLAFLVFLIFKRTRRTPPGENGEPVPGSLPDTPQDDSGGDKSKKIKPPSLNQAFVDQVVKKLTNLMEEKKIYQEDTISLHSLADMLSINHHQLSQVLNENLKKSFSDYINYYRIEEAKELLRDPKRRKQKIITIAFDVGYNTKAAFYNVFRKHTNMTPTQYRNTHLKGEGG